MSLTNLLRHSLESNSFDIHGPISTAQADEEDEEVRSRVSYLWAAVDSGFLSAMIFFVAMLLYIRAVPLGQSTKHSDLVYQSWLRFFAAILFVVESLIDLVWGVKRQIHAVEAIIMRTSTASSLSSRTEGLTTHCAPWIDRIPWDVLGALFFLIPSIFYLFSALLDPNIVVLSWLNVLSGHGVSDADYSTICSQIAASLFIFDAVLGLVGRWSYIRTTPERDRLISLQVWRIRGVFELDWAAWGDIIFFIGSIVAELQQFATYNLTLDYVAQISWTLDGVVYCIASWPTFVSLVRGDDDSVTLRLDRLCPTLARTLLPRT